MSKLYIGEELIFDPDEFQLKGSYISEESLDNFVSTEDSESFINSVFCNCDDYKYDTLENKNPSTLYVVNEYSPIAGDIVLYDNTDNKIKTVSYTKFDTFITSSNINNYEPIGIVVVPKSHNVYKTNEYGIMALKYATNKEPENGSNVYTYFTSYSAKSFNRLQNYNKYPFINTTSGLTDTVQGLSMNKTYLSSSNARSEKNTYTKNEYYNIKFYVTYKFAPSPYTISYTRNENFYIDDKPTYVNNAFSDFNGKYNTKFLISKSTYQLNWETTSYIINENKEGCFPAPCCCYRYTTYGTNKGDWYLPAAGELIYLVSQLKIIVDAMYKINNNFANNNNYINKYIFSYNLLSSSKNDNMFNTVDLYSYTITASTDRLVALPFMRGNFEVITHV